MLLPIAYQPPTRLARKHVLNTIIEDRRGEKEEGSPRSENPLSEDGRGRGRSLELSRSQDSGSPVPSLTSSISSYYHTRRNSTDNDSLYDLSDDDSRFSPSVVSDHRSYQSTSPSPLQNDRRHKKYPSLIIPSPSFWPSIDKAHKANEALPPRPPKIPLSPANLSMLGHDLPMSSNPPSLVASLSSHAGASVPSTPDSEIHNNGGCFWGSDEKKVKDGKPAKPSIRICTNTASVSYPGSAHSFEDRISVRDFASNSPLEFHSPVLGSDDGISESGIELPADALRTLQHLSLEIPATADIILDEEDNHEMEEAQAPLRRRSSAEWTPASQVSDYSISQISIPSPSDFFSSLGRNARHTWTLGSVPASALPPSSTTAENFYNCPWNRVPTSNIVGQVIEVPEDETEGSLTAQQKSVPSTSTTLTAIRLSPRMGADEAMDLHDEDYDQALKDSATKSLDRTGNWLAEQTSYLSALRETNPVNDLQAEAETKLKRISLQRKDSSLDLPMRKAVKFLESQTAQKEFSGDKITPEETIYYQAFQHLRRNSRRSDVFRHRQARSDSAQTIRISIPNEHVDRLRGKFQIKAIERPSSHRPISMMPGKEENKPEQTSEQKAMATVERERQALEQVDTRAWMVEATRCINGGNLMLSPAKLTLARVPALGDLSNGRVMSPARVLDLGGQPNGDWAWHCSREFPHSRIYTATTERCLIDSRIQGPRNHKRNSITNLWTLPYPDNYFTAISARSLFAHLKTERPEGLSLDEYDLCLAECMRCLKPGGYLEFFALDSEIINAGVRATAVSVEFGFNLKTRGYDPLPTRSMLGRLRRAGFEDIKRAWMILPMGTPTVEARALPETPPPNMSSFEVDKLEAVQGPVGSTANAASITGLVGSSAWEQWLLKLELEMGKKNLLEGVGAMLEEGKGTGAGWRSLSGWARKPE